MDLERAREILLDHARKPRNVRRDPNIVTHAQGECRNPLCGDLVRVFLNLEDSKIVNCTLEVQGCTMCTASASLMSEQVTRLAVMDVQKMSGNFRDTLLDSDSAAAWPAPLEALGAFAHLRINRARIPCALIAWHALDQALNSRL